MAGTASLAEVVQNAMRSLSSRTFTGLPAEVVSYNAATNTITARIVVKAPYFKSDGEREWDEYPLLPSVPVIWTRGHGAIVATGLEAGDFVWLVFSSQSLAEWRLTGQLSEPRDSRRNSIGYPFAIPGAFPDAEPLDPLDIVHLAAGQAIFGKAGGKQVRAGATGIEIAPAGVTPVSPIALSVPTDSALATCVTAINAVIATLNALVSAYNAHTHVTSCGAGAGSAARPESHQATAAGAGPAAPGTTAATSARSI